MRDFRKLDIWKNGIELVKQVYQLSDKLPSDEKFGLRSQLTRASVSVPSNIAEGRSRNSEVEFKRFLEIAMGSLFEIETQLIIA
ncbi:four helix bundle protein [Hyunsoonleella rubra]|uniref:Four helix bundle protein n=1 Tax=Hyunsoonleella rubra TaxID=1737062 RepID=A0ABW5T8M1_9FLAO